MELNQTNQYQIQGKIVEDIVKEFGSPLYLYDAQIIESQIGKLNAAFSDLRFKIKYASKALTNISILKLIKKLGCEVDAVSLEEVEIAFRAGFSKEQILFTPNSVGIAEITKAVDLGVYVNIDNIYILEEFGKKYGNTQPCCIRINPHIEAGGNQKIKTGHKESKFGISIDYSAEIEAVVEKFNINVTGLHIHTGSDFSDVEVFVQAANLLFDFAKKFKNIKIFDFGSGFKVAYKKGDKTTDLELLGNKITEAVKKFASEYGSEPEIWFEPGKFIVSDAGILLTTTNVLKQTPATLFAGIDSGLNHLIRPMMYDAYHEILNISNPMADKSEYSVVGYICETDTFAWNRSLNEVRAGDILAILNAGAYGMSMSSNYNARPRPAEVLVYEGKAHLIRNRETLEDILRNQIALDL